MYFLAAARRPDELMERTAKAAEVLPNHWVVHTGRGLAHQLRGQLPEAIAELEKAVETSGGISLALKDLGYAYALAGQREDAERMEATILSKARERGRDVPAVVGKIRAGLGDRDGAFEALEHGFLRREPTLLYLKTSYWLDALREDPRYDDLVRRVGLP